MTNKEAIAELETRYLTMSQCANKAECRRANEALDKAIKALEKETVSRESYEHEYFLRKELEIKVAKLEKQTAEQEDVLNKLRTEIEQRLYGVANDSVIQGMKYERAAVLEILDKYKPESELKDENNE